MSSIAHLFFALGYSVVALTVALAVPIAVPAISLEIGLVLGCFAFLLGALAHEAVARRRSEVRTLRRMAALRRIDRDFQDQLDLAHKEARRVHEVLQNVGGARPEEQRRVDDVIAEVKVLQSLVGKLTAHPRSDAEPDAKAGATWEPKDDRPAATPVAGQLNDAQILDIVREGLSSDRVDLYLQPIVSLPQRKRRYFECFSRIRAEDGSIIVPGQYLKIAEQEGYINTIDNMLLFRCVQLVRRTQTRKYNVGFFCNISRHSLEDTAFFHDFVKFMQQNPELAPNLFFEFTQADLAAHQGSVLKELDRLRELGFRFSVDQVSDLNLDVDALANRQFGFVKVEAGILLGKIRSDPPEVDVRDFKAVLDRAGIDLIVQKIEGESDLVELLDYNIDFGQGFLFGEPRPAREI